MRGSDSGNRPTVLPMNLNPILGKIITGVPASINGANSRHNRPGSDEKFGFRAELALPEFENLLMEIAQLQSEPGIAERQLKGPRMASPPEILLIPPRHLAQPHNSPFQLSHPANLLHA